MILSRRNIVSGLAAITAALPFMSGLRAAKAAEPQQEYIHLEGNRGVIFRLSKLDPNSWEVHSAVDGKIDGGEHMSPTFLVSYSDYAVTGKTGGAPKEFMDRHYARDGWYLTSILDGEPIGMHFAENKDGSCVFTSLTAAKMAAASMVQEDFDLFGDDPIFQS